MLTPDTEVVLKGRRQGVSNILLTGQNWSVQVFNMARLMHEESERMNKHCVLVMVFFFFKYCINYKCVSNIFVGKTKGEKHGLGLVVVGSIPCLPVLSLVLVCVISLGPLLSF